MYYPFWNIPPQGVQQASNQQSAQQLPNQQAAQYPNGINSAYVMPEQGAHVGVAQQYVNAWPVAHGAAPMASTYQVAVSADMLAKVRDEYQRRLQCHGADESGAKKDRREEREAGKETRRESERDGEHQLKRRHKERIELRLATLPQRIKDKVSQNDIDIFAEMIGQRNIFVQLVELRRAQAQKERNLLAERQLLVGDAEGLANNDKEIVRALDQMVTEQQMCLSRAGLPLFALSNAPDDVELQMALLRVVADLMEGGLNKL